MLSARRCSPRFPRSHPAASTLTLTLVSAAALAGASAAPAQEADGIRAELFSPMRARSIGPAGMSGRVAAVDVVLGDRNVIYVGAATGGLWKSSDGGLVWEPVFDDQPLLGIGSVAVFQANPDIVWVGTGEGNPRNSAGVGNGVYRSIDGGRTWSHLGLRDSERIHRIILHPDDPDIAWVGAMGPAWRDGGDRGVFKTEDGGATWEAVLQVNERTGVADMVMDPSNPDKIFVALWEYRRWPWFFQSGGPGSGLYLTRDGGASWARLGPEQGLPDGDLGRIGLGISRSSPDVVYALVEAKRSALLRSDDGGVSFRTVNDEPGIANRPFYYADLRVDPKNENRIYSLHSAIQVSEDSGRTFRTVVPSAIIHGDVHELWIDPDDPRRMIIGEDGGIAFTYNRGDTWRFVENLPLAQFYQINVDMAVPFNVYGGLQDNGSWYGPSEVWEDRGIMNAHWRRVGGGDGFATITDFTDPRFGYTQSQQGSISRFDKETGARAFIQPIHPDGVRLRFNWNAAMNVDPHDSTTIYLGSQFVHRSRDRGSSWEIISPDLTTDDPEKQRQMASGGLTLDATGAENHTTILSIAPSPLEPGVIWVTTDDGNVQLTRDGGTSWENLSSRIGGAPDGGWASHVEPSRHRPGRAYVVFDEHRRGDWTPYVFRTDDYGESWTSLADPGLQGFAHVIEEDPVEPNLLFLGTEFGLWVSVDGGGDWMSWRHGMPPAPVRALMVHPRDHDLVIGTHGRAAWILDDVRPLRTLATDPGVSEAPLTVLPLAPARQHEVAERIGYRSTGHAMQFGENRPYGALIHYWVGPSSAADDMEAKIRILDRSGEVVRTLAGPSKQGLNRVEWDLGLEPVAGAGFGGGGVEVLPGEYTVRVAVGGATAEGALSVLPDPRVAVSEADRLARMEAILEVRGWLEDVAAARDRLQAAVGAVSTALDLLAARDAEGAGMADLSDQGGALLTRLVELDQRLFSGPECQGICGGDPIADGVRTPLRYLTSTAGPPTATALLALEQARVASREVIREVDEVINNEVNDFRNAIAASGLSVFSRIGPLSSERQGGN